MHPLYEVCMESQILVTVPAQTPKCSASSHFAGMVSIQVLSQEFSSHQARLENLFANGASQVRSANLALSVV